jgi:hypothetical protein
MATTYRIHPAIGIARLGNAPRAFCISPEKPAALPIDCDAAGNPRLAPDGTELPVATFKDDEGRIKRQAARFQIYVHDDESPDGRPLAIGDPVSGGGNQGVLIDIQWRAYVANKKASWYEFQQLSGEHGYAPDHPRRNPQVTAPEARERLIIDPGPRVVDCTETRSARFDRDGGNVYAPVFPPPLKPCSIETLGEIKTDDAGRLLVLGGHGSSGTYLYDDFGQPRIDTYANNDGWFDDTSDGPVTARLVMHSPEVDRTRFIDVEYPAWVIVGYPAYVPQILDMVTLEEVIEDLAVTQFATRTDLYGQAGTFDSPPVIDPTDTEALILWRAGRLRWNPTFKPWFYRDIWPILFRADQFTYLTTVLEASNYPHNQSARGNFDPFKLGVPPRLDPEALARCEKACLVRHQSGRLFVETLHPALELLDRQGEIRLLRRAATDAANAANAAHAAAAPAGGLTAAASPAAGAPAGGRTATASPDAAAAKLTAAAAGAVRARRRAGDAAPPTGESGSGSDPLGRFSGALRRALHAFADEVMGAEPPTDPTRYLAAWRHASQGAPGAAGAAAPGAPGAPDAPDAKERLDRAVDKALADLAEQPAAGPELARQARLAVAGHLKLYASGQLLEHALAECIASSTRDPYRNYRQFLFDLLREPGEENRFRVDGKPSSRVQGLPLMPLLAGDNPLSNTLPSKFLRLTEMQFYLLRQWALGLFFNEDMEGWAHPDPWQPYAGWVNRNGRDLDRGVLTNLLGGAFCPGGEVGWIVRNPAIYLAPYRVKADPTFSSFRLTAAQASSTSGGVPEEDYSAYIGQPLSQDDDFDRGLQPGDLTKQMALPWQADFNECTTQTINVTYDEWNNLYPASERNSLLRREEAVWETLWWPAHRPLQVFEAMGDDNYPFVDWSRGIPQTNAGDLKMVTAWSRLPFVRANPAADDTPTELPPPQIPPYVAVERTADAPGPRPRDDDPPEE